MPTATIPPVAHYRPAPETQEEIECATVPIIDFAKNDRMVDIVDISFSAVPEDRQSRFLSEVRESGVWKGYKPRQFRIQGYSMVRPAFEQQHPAALHELIPEIHAFMEYNHFNMLHPILRLLALVLELPEETFVEQHRFDAEGMTFLRFAKYYPRTEDEEAKTKNVRMKGHTDSTTISVLWNQPVVALQIMSPDGKWRDVKYIPNSVIVNAGDAMEMLSGGYYKANIHRVVQPPADQRGHTRLGMFYFAFTNDDVRLVPFKESPILQRARIIRKCEDEDAPTMKMWGGMRASTYGNMETEQKGNGVEEQVVNGVVVKYYN